MEGSNPNGGATRRLPSWMLAAQANDPVNKSRDTSNNAKHLKVGLDSESRSKRNPKNLALHNENENSKGKQGSAAEGKRNRGKRKISTRNPGSDGEIQEIVAEGIESKRSAERVRESAPQGRKRRSRRKPIHVPEDNDSSQITSAGDSGDDLDLTVEDLMSIAHEYISANGDVQEQNLACEASINEISTAEARSVQVNTVAADSSEPKPPPTSICVSESSCETVMKEEIVVPIKTTGDPAQDMLNLLLGPLLNKRVNEEEKKSDELLTNSMVFSEEVKPSQATSVVGDRIPQLKKKTSLKDKIAMFLE